jgi:hypothetical protein
VIRIHFAGEDLRQSRNRLAISCGVVTGDAHPYQDLAAFGRDRWRPAPFEEADVVVYALPYEEGPETRKLAERARDAGLPCIFFRANDDPTPANPPHGVVYRTSLYRSRLTPRELAMPAFTDDLLEECGGELVARARGERPTVGFCGHVGTAGDRLYENLVGLLRGNRDKAVGMGLRHRALETLRASRRVDTNFIARTQIWGGASTGAAQWDAARRAAVRREYLDNILASDYCLCLRGKGNYSFRFYEVFAMGRVPLFVDTDCVLPFEDEIDWRSRCVWVDQSEMARIGDIVADFHAARSDDDLRQLQLDNRKLWEDYLRPSSIYARILERALRGTARAASA